MNKLSDNHPSSSITCQVLTLDNVKCAKDIFQHIAHLPWSMWLDSCNSDHVDNRYDILVWQPKITLTTSGNETQITEVASGKVTLSDQDPFTLLKQTQTAFFKQYSLPQSALPFIGGSVGYFSYDLGRRIESLPSIAKKDIHLPEMAIGLYNHSIIFDNTTQQIFLTCPEHERTNIENWLQTNCQKNIQLSPFSLKKDWQSNMTRSQYHDKFDQVQEYLLSGDCYQINLAQRFTAPYSGDEFSAYLALRESNNAPFSAFLRFDDTSVLSVSPERFLQLKQNKVQSKPIKGTRPRSNDKLIDAANAKALLNAPKDRAENLMIVDLLRNDISKVCQAGTVKVPSLFAIESFPAVHHLVSTVVGEISPSFDGCDLLRAAFPGGSITGAPKIRAMEIIDELEPQRRSVYCGSIGYISACGTMDSSITIRTLICENSKVYCWAGGGLVADSDVDSEYQETFDKVKKILPVLEM